MNENLVQELSRRGICTDTFRRLPSDKKERIYRTSLILFGEYGYDGFSIDRMCYEAGISKGSFFQYFLSKGHLLEFTILLFDDYLARWVVEIKNAELSSHTRDRLRHLYQALIINSRLHKSEEKFYHFVVNAGHHSAVAIEGIDLERHFHNYVTRIIERGELTGEVRGDFDVELTSHLVSMILDALVRRQFSGRRVPRRETEEYLISFLFDGISAK